MAKTQYYIWSVILPLIISVILTRVKFYPEEPEELDLRLNLLRSKPSENLVFSPINVEHAFAILASAAAGETR